jgi:hypothetical protein
MMDKVRKPSNSEGYAASPEPLRLDLLRKVKEKGKAIPVRDRGGP